MKRISFIFLLCSLCLFILCSCGDKINEEDPSEKPTNTTASRTVTVTFPEGFTAVQIAERLEESKVCEAKEFLALVTDWEYISSLDYRFIGKIKNPENRAFILEGYIFPDTYEFYKNENPKKALSRFLNNTERKLKDEYYERAKELGYSLDEIITLSSIVEKEGAVKAQNKKISSVIHNRIENPAYGKIQCDVTINYVNDYIIDSPYLSGDTDKFRELYNTYKCVGLPAGPITNPGITSIEAGLYPEDTDYYFFVTDEDWNYYYAETYEEHKKNCAAVGISG